MLEIKQFDDVQIVLLRPLENGRKELVATLTGPNREANAAAIVEAEDRIAKLTAALQLFTQAVGGPNGYIPTLGAPKTREALNLMKEAGVKPVYYGD